MSSKNEIARRIYVACLASYNNGRLHGAWIDCDGKDADELRAEIADMLRASPYPNVMVRDAETGEKVPSAEEWAVHDHEGFAGLIQSEWPDIDQLAELAAFLDDADDDARRGLLWLVNERGSTIAGALDQADDVRTFEGEASDYAAELVEECWPKALDALPDFVRHAIDWQAVARDLILGGDIAEAEQGGDRFIITNASEF